MDTGLLIGVDGGGTYTRAVAVRPDGIVVAAASGSGINYNNIGLSTARKNLKTVVDSLLSRCGGTECGRLVVGLSALDFPADEETLRRFAGDTFDARTLDLESDAYTALMGVTQGAPGVIAICGTGSMLLLLDENGKQHVSGGWGHALGDVGSSYTMAVEGIRAAINAWEGMSESTALCEAILSFYGVSAPRAIIEKIYTPIPEPGKVAQFARIVIDLAQRDATAYTIVRDNMLRLARQTATLMRGHDGVSRVGVYGGVFQHNPWVRELYQEELVKCRPQTIVLTPSYPPEVGAVIHAFIKNGTLTEDVLRNLHSSAASVLH